uniref:40S ribosomal protein S4 n=1 Tax=Rhabditophanes sp. KR3021 TaxID=114890 RepID=A0AC35UDG0_9BILA
MVRGPKHHLKRIAAPKHWMLDKLGGVFAPRPTAGPHKLRESLPLVLFLRNRLKYALCYNDARAICKERMVKVDGKVRTDIKYPAGFMDVITLEKTNETFRLLYDVKGRYTTHRITKQEGNIKLVKVKSVYMGPKGVPMLSTHDGRSIRYPDPHVKNEDTAIIDVETGKITDFIKFDAGNLCMITGGRNTGRVGIIGHRERHPGSFDIVHIKDNTGKAFATRASNVFVIGKGTTPLISLPSGKGIKLTIAEERDARIASRKKQ